MLLGTTIFTIKVLVTQNRNRLKFWKILTWISIDVDDVKDDPKIRE